MSLEYTFSKIDFLSDSIDVNIANKSILARTWKYATGLS